MTVVKMGREGSKKDKRFKLHEVDKARKLEQRKNSNYITSARKTKREV